MLYDKIKKIIIVVSNSEEELEFKKWHCKNFTYMVYSEIVSMKKTELEKTFLFFLSKLKLGMFK